MKCNGAGRRRGLPKEPIGVIQTRRDGRLEQSDNWIWWEVVFWTHLESKSNGVWSLQRPLRLSFKDCFIVGPDPKTLSWKALPGCLQDYRIHHLWKEAFAESQGIVPAFPMSPWILGPSLQCGEQQVISTANPATSLQDFCQDQSKCLREQCSSSYCCIENNPKT